MYLKQSKSFGDPAASARKLAEIKVRCPAPCLASAACATLLTLIVPANPPWLLYRRPQFALNVIGFSDEEQSDIARILAAILHLGNITFVDSGQDVATVSDKQRTARPREGCTGLFPAANNVALCPGRVAEPTQCWRSSPSCSKFPTTCWTAR